MAMNDVGPMPEPCIMLRVMVSGGVVPAGVATDWVRLVK